MWLKDVEILKATLYINVNEYICEGGKKVSQEKKRRWNSGSRGQSDGLWGQRKKLGGKNASSAPELDKTWEQIVPQ